MPTMSNELVDAMKAFLPGNSVARTIAFARPLSTSGSAYERFLASVPRAIVQAYLDGSDSFTVCYLEKDGDLGFRLPKIRRWVPKTITEIDPAWLQGTGKRIWDYCVANDLSPKLSRRANREIFKSTSWGEPTYIGFKNCCELTVSWQRLQLARLLGLKAPADHRTAAAGDSKLGNYDATQVRIATDTIIEARRVDDEEAETRRNRMFDEESYKEALLQLPKILPKIDAAVADGKYGVRILGGSADYPGFTVGNRRSGGDWRGTDYRMFDRTDCYPGIVARGLCIWAGKQNYRYEIHFSESRAGGSAHELVDLNIFW